MTVAHSHCRRFRADLMREAWRRARHVLHRGQQRHSGNVPDQSSSDAKRSPRTMRRRTMMRVSWIILAAGLLLSGGAPTAASAQGWFFGQQEPATYQAMHPDRDVLNGGALTPAGRMGLERPYGAAPV